MLNIDKIKVAYHGKVVLDQFSMSMKEGEIICIVGESGSGKTTAIRAILGLLSGNGKITSGKILWKGSSLTEKTEKELQTIRGNEIAMIFQNSIAMLNPIRTIGSQFIEYVRLHKKMSRKDAYQYAVEKLEMVQLKDAESIMKRYPFQLSGGMCQRVSIAMAMSFHPSLLLADEPTSALDVTTQEQIIRQMMEMNKKYKTGILMATHNLGVAAYMADKIIVMKNGSVIEAGTRDKIIYHPSMEYTKSLLQAIPEIDGERYVG